MGPVLPTPPTTLIPTRQVRRKDEKPPEDVAAVVAALLVGRLPVGESFVGPSDDRPGRRKFGYAVNAELPLADQGDTGLFARAGWNDGHTESFAFAEVDRTLSGGIQLSGAHWGRPTDHLGIAFAINGLSAAHRDYLALGGKGFTLGDGALSYGHERIIEAYYSYAVFNHFTLSPDIQLVRHPGYNRDRGPARFIGLRAHLEL